ncbi:FHA domain containing protein [Calothrix sp. NIES-4071]|nr:FHA domain containing protein [Calothrix sp. NIES-4071]BAZ61225.1 FHA domain containing protein [Calothrix sp. NIES-4105]
MNWLIEAPKKPFPLRYRIIVKTVKSLFALLLVLNLASCGDKAVSTEPSASSGRSKTPQLTNQISEVAPPSVIQELQRSLDNYRPQVTIITPKFDEVLSQDTVEVNLQVKDLPVFKDSQFNLGSHLQVILDDRAGIEVYDLNQPLSLPDLPPGTHTLRVFAERPWYESYKNEGAYAQTKFHVFTKTDEHNPDTSQPLLTYNRPNGQYGAEPILLDFYLTNAPLQLNGRDILQDSIGDWRIRCTINDESFVLDRWESIYLKGFKPGKNWVKLEFLDGKGEVVKNVFNSTVRSFTYEPKGKDALSRIVRGELSADQVRSIVDSSYIAKEPLPEPTPTIEPTIAPTVEPTIEPTPEAKEPEVVPLTEPAKPKSGGFFKRREKAPLPAPSIEPTPIETPNLPEVIITPTPQPEVTNIPEKAPEVEKPTPEPEIIPTPEATTPETETLEKVPDVEPIIESPTPQPEVTPTQKPSKVQLGKYFKRRESVQPTPEPTLSPAPEITPEPEITPVPEITPEKEITPLPEVTSIPVPN